MKMSIESGRLFIFCQILKKCDSVRTLNTELGFLRNDKDCGNYSEYCIEIKLRLGDGIFSFYLFSNSTIHQKRHRLRNFRHRRILQNRHRLLSFHRRIHHLQNFLGMEKIRLGNFSDLFY